MKLMTPRLIYHVLKLMPIIAAAVSCGQIKSQPNKLAGVTRNKEVEVLSLLPVADKPEDFQLTFGFKNDTSLRVSMIVGKYEAQSLAITLEHLKPTAPLPLDILEEAITKFGYSLKQVTIDSLIDSVYTAKIICTKDDSTIAFKARPVDATTIALKFNTPIFVNPDFLSR